MFINYFSVWGFYIPKKQVIPFIVEYVVFYTNLIRRRSLQFLYSRLTKTME